MKRSQFKVDIGQRFRKQERNGLEFEVVAPVKTGPCLHVRVARVGWPTDTRLFSISALFDERYFTVVSPALK